MITRPLLIALVLGLAVLPAAQAETADELRARLDDA